MNKHDEVLKHMGQTPSDLVFWSFRYFIGRATISTVHFAEGLAKAWPYLDINTWYPIKKELELAFERDDIARSAKEHSDVTEEYNGSYPLGHDIDRAAWEKVRKAYQSQ